MDLLSNDEPLINLHDYDAQNEGPDLLNEESLHRQNQRRLNARHSSSGSLNHRQNRMSSGSKLYLQELAPVRKEQSMERENSAIVSAVERTMKNYADGVLRVLEGMSGRLSQLESTTQDLEQLVASVKLSVDDYHEDSDQNFKILSERIMETHRAVQILRDKQDIFEAHAVLAKLQTSKALVEKESAKPSGMTVDSMDPINTSKQQEHIPKVQSQQSLQHSQQLVPSQPPSQQFLPTQQTTHQHSLQPLPLQQPNQHLPPAQPPMPQSQPLMLAQHYQAPSVLSEQPGVQQEFSLNQAQYHGLPQQMQLQQILPQVTTSLQPLQVTTQPNSQMAGSREHIRYLPAPAQMQLLPHLSQQIPRQQPNLVTQQVSETTQFQQQRQIQQMLPPPPAPLPPSLQQSQPEQPPSQGPPRPPPLMQQIPTSRPQASVQYYGQSNDTQNYALGTPSFAPSGYVLETSRDPSNFTPHQHPFSTIPAQQPPQLHPSQNYVPQIPQSSHERHAGNVWKQHSSPTPSRLPTAQPVRVDAGSPEVNGIVQKVAAMGFSREQVQNVIRRLAESNQAIDMNVVLDTLMNGGFPR